MRVIAYVIQLGYSSRIRDVRASSLVIQNKIQWMPRAVFLLGDSKFEVIFIDG